MSRTEDTYRETDARRKGYYAGMFGDSPDSFPYQALNTATAWRDGYAEGKKARRRMSQRQVRAW